MKTIKNQALALVVPSLLAFGPSAFAITIANPVALAPATAGSGLVGSYYGQVSNNNLIFNTDCAVDYISNHKPVATFNASQINYPGGGFNFAWDNITLGAFLGKDAATLSKKGVADNQLTGQLFDFTGYLSVKTAGKYTFSLASDDGARLTINGKTVVDNHWSQAFASQSEEVTFKEAGLYPINVAYFENWGATGIRLSSNLNESMAPIAPSLFYSPASIKPNSVPEPGSVALLIGIGTLGCGLLRKRKK